MSVEPRAVAAGPVAPVPGARAAAPPRLPAATVAGVAVHLPEQVVDVAVTERELHRRSPGATPRIPMVSRLTGVQRVHRLPDEWDASDLAVAAAGKLLADQGIGADDVDLLVFASASQDMVEP